MAVKLKRPILVGGIGLTCGAWMWSAIAPSVADLAGASIWGAIAIGSGVWLFNRRSTDDAPPQSIAAVKPVTIEQVEQAFAKVENFIEKFSAEANRADLPASSIEAVVHSAQAAVDHLRRRMDESDRSLMIVGDRGAGKSSLHQWLQAYGVGAKAPSQAAWANVTIFESSDSDAYGADLKGLQLSLSQSNAFEADAPASNGSEAASLTGQEFINGSIHDSDLTLFVTSGDLTDASFREIQHLTQHHHHVVVVLNQHDRYLPDERSTLLQHLRQRLDGMVQPQNVVSAAIAPAPIKVRQYGADGSAQERMEAVGPDGAALVQQLELLLDKERQQLRLMTTLRQADLLRVQLQTRINQVRRDRAMPVIEEYQWIAAAATFANPVPTLDVMAIAAVNAQLVIDLGQFYKLQVSTAQAKIIAGTLAELMVKLGLVELASQALSPLLKGNVMTFAAGGAIQGISAAYLTRVAGLSLIEFFEQHGAAFDSEPETSVPQLSFETLAPYVQAVFRRHRRTEFLQSLVQQGVAKLVSLKSTRKTAEIS